MANDFEAALAELSDDIALEFISYDALEAIRTALQQAQKIESGLLPLPYGTRSEDVKKINDLPINGWISAKDHDEQQRLAVYIRRRFGKGTAAKRTINGDLRVYRKPAPDETKG
jgi:hypothetical protein